MAELRRREEDAETSARQTSAFLLPLTRIAISLGVLAAIASWRTAASASWKTGGRAQGCR